MERKSSKECSVFFFVDTESFWLRNRPLTNSAMFSSWRSAKRSCFEIHSRQQSFGRLFKKIFYSMITKITFLKGSCHVNDVQIFIGRNSAGFISTFYLQILIVHFFCIQIHRTFRSFHFVIDLMLWQPLSYSTNEIIYPILKRIVID